MVPTAGDVVPLAEGETATVSVWVGPKGAGLIGTAAIAQTAADAADQLMVTELPAACSVLADPRIFAT
jgi:hypothetical protein